MFLTDYLGLPRGHSGIDFVDVRTDDDTELFIDPCLIELAEDRLSQEAMTLIADFEDTLYADMRSGRWETTHIFDVAHEIHDTKLGYGNGRNGKGKTPEGMRKSLDGLCSLANGIPEISRIQDVSVFVEDFAEDCMSDLLTNILHRVLCEFTAEQMALYGVNPDGFHEVKAWSRAAHRWAASEQPFWLINGRRILLVPKHWVRKRFLFKAHQYLCGVIIERMRDEHGYDGLSKLSIWRNMERETEHWEYDRVVEFTKENPDALEEYHSRMLWYYRRARGRMSNADLDFAVYGYCEAESA